ncbi:hypothetical protein BFN03_08785 [Rhodococcus sp. WMMA185]|nr:hypothetical protein BFN03_08785 [Rhodococcus sp. WMMA185]
MVIVAVPPMVIVAVPPMVVEAGPPIVAVPSRPAVVVRRVVPVVTRVISSVVTVATAAEEDLGVEVRVDSRHADVTGTVHRGSSRVRRSPIFLTTSRPANSIPQFAATC